MNGSKVFDLMTDASPIASELVRVLEAKGIGVSTWAVAMAMALLSIELDGKRVDPDFIHGILKTIYRIQTEAEQTIS